jgi:hypothetical protein
MGLTKIPFSAQLFKGEKFLAFQIVLLMILKFSA